MSLPSPDVNPTIRAPRDKAAREIYETYLQSPSWRITRNRALRLSDWHCSKCDSRRNLQVHHKTYERLGHEWDQDLIVLCRSCHEDHHDLDRAQRGVSLQLHLKLANSLLTSHRHQLQTFADLSDALKTECAKLHIPYDHERISKVLGLIVGKHGLEQPSHHVIRRDLPTSPQPLNRYEAWKVVCRLLEKDHRLRIRTMVHTSAPHAIDGPIPRADWGDHDRY